LASQIVSIGSSSGEKTALTDSNGHFIFDFVDTEILSLSLDGKAETEMGHFDTIRLDGGAFLLVQLKK
jgi:hypothetical protein